MSRNRFRDNRLCAVFAVCGLFGLACTGGMVWAQQKPAPPLNVSVKPDSEAARKVAPPAPLLKPISAPGATPLELRMKFKPGDINKYQMSMQANILLPGQPAGAVTRYDTNISMVIQQRVVKVNMDGSADVAISTLSGLGIVGGQTLKVDLTAKPSLITFDTRNNIVTIKNLPQNATSNDVTGKIFQSGALSTQGVYLPKQAVKIGDKWTQKVNISSLGKDNSGTVETKLVRLETVGLFETVRLRSVMKIPFVIVDKTSKPPIPLNGMLNMVYDSNLALHEGKVVRSTGTGDITVVVGDTSVKSVPTSKPKIGAKNSPGDKAEPPKNNLPSAPAQKVTVKLQLGNNLLTQ
jgi:hypothetical protein